MGINYDSKNEGMIRSRSTVSVPLSINSSASSISLKDMPPSPNSNIAPSSKFPGGSKLWKTLICGFIMGIMIYIGIYFNTSFKSTQVYKKNKFGHDEIITVVMNTFQRHEQMEASIDYYASCNLVKYIYIVWSEPAPVPQRISAKYINRQHPQISFLVHTEDSLNNRFLPIPLDHTEAIFSVDDDMRVSCHDLNQALEVWKASKNSLIGFMPRIHLRGKDGQYVYRCWWRVWWHGAYSIILTKAALFHHRYLEAYSNTMPKTIRDMVDNETNCEDIAMQFLISNMTKLPPIYVKGSLEDVGALNGISTSKNIISAKHMDKRSQCLNDLIRIYGKDPLVKSHIIVDSASNGWTNAPSTWLEYISSDLWKF